MIALDVETAPTTVGNQLPRVVCVNVANDAGLLDVLPRARALPIVESALRGEHGPIVGHNIAYDMGCIAATWPHLVGPVFEAYERGLIRCTMHWAQLVDYALGEKQFRYGLGYVCDRYGIPHANKGKVQEGENEDPWRLRFAEIDAVPIEYWPHDALVYCLLDAQSTLALARALPDVPNVAEQARYAFWLRLSSAFGMLTDGERVERWAAEKSAAFTVLQERFIKEGWLKWNKSKDCWSRNMKVIEAAIDQASGGAAPRTPGGKVSTSADTCLEIGGPQLEAYAEYLDLQACLTRELKFLRQGIIHTRYDLAETGRSTSSKPNVQNFSRESGSRLCIRPRPGHVFAICDFRILELSCLGQLCVEMGCGDILAREIREGGDPHATLSAMVLGCTRDELADHPERKPTRLAAKAANFGFPGGAGVDTWVAYARASGVRIERARAERIRNAWRRLRPDVLRYQQTVSRWLDGQCPRCDRPIQESVCGQCGSQAEYGMLRHYRSGRLRGRLSFTQGCNSLFQGLGGDVTKETGWRLTRAGFAIAAFVHDEYLIELPIGGAAEGCRQIARIAAEVCAEWLPHAPSSIEPTLATRWVKDDPLYDSAGVLQVIDCENR